MGLRWQGGGERHCHYQVTGGVDSASDFQGVEESWLLSLPWKSTWQETKDQTMSGFGWELDRGEARTYRPEGTRDEQTPPGTNRVLGTGQWRKMGGITVTVTVSDSIRRQRAQRQAAEAGWWEQHAGGQRFAPVEDVRTRCKWEMNLMMIGYVWGWR